MKRTIQAVIDNAESIEANKIEIVCLGGNSRSCNAHTVRHSSDRYSNSTQSGSATLCGGGENDVAMAQALSSLF